MNIIHVYPEPDWVLRVVAEDGRKGTFDLKPYLGLPVFQPLRNETEFRRVRSGRYYVEWACGADISADTVEAKLEPDNASNVEQAAAVAEHPAAGGYRS
jgi:hypothetical protein